jgi:hypothetical protein
MAAPASALSPAASAAEPPLELTPRGAPAAASRASTAAANVAPEDLSLPATRKGHLSGLKRLLTRPRKEVVMFLGAGFLMPLGPTFGSWKGLLQAMIERAKSTPLGEEAHIKKELERANAVLENAGGSGAKLQRVAQLIEDTVGDDHMTKLGIELLELPPEVYDEKLKAEFLLSQTYAEHTRIERLSRAKLIEELKVRVPTPEAQKLEELTLEELKAKRKDARDPSDIKASLVTHPSDDDKKKGKGIVQFRKRIAMVRLLPLKAIITTKRVAERKDHPPLARTHAHTSASRKLTRSFDLSRAVLPSSRQRTQRFSRCGRMKKGASRSIRSRAPPRARRCAACCATRMQRTRRRRRGRTRESLSWNS